MFVKQLSIFVQNEPGRLAEITDTIAASGIDIRALSLADTAEYGILRLIVNKPEDATAALKAKGLTVKLTDVIAVEVDDKPGEFSKALRFLADGGISVEYLYVFLSRKSDKASAILRVDDNEKAEKVLAAHKVNVISAEKLYN